MKTKPNPQQMGFINVFILALGMLFASNSFAASGVTTCNTVAWLGGASGAFNPNDPNHSVPRVKGFCGLEVTGTGHVQDDSPTAETSFVGHFYFLPDFSGSGSTDIFVAYTDNTAATEAIVISYDGSNIIIDASAIGGGSATVAAVSGWNLVEFAWESGTTGNFWVNADATSDPVSATFTPGSGSIEAVRLGAPNGLGGFTGRSLFDEYVSNRTQAVGALLMGDANDDSSINIFDMAGVQNEILNNALQSGQPDCNADGNINIFDMACIQIIILN
ncbi:MAG: dockerin type I repeat-containing protein [Xanthomonadales bacterium]|nr:dockerin type I repeat-containing protein [Xanthomonadales bacterium]